MGTSTQDRPQEAGWYEIRLQGRLDQRWVHWFDGLGLVPGADGTTLLRGRITDQAALHGLLAAIHDAGLPLISVARVEPDSSKQHSPTETDMTTTSVPPTPSTTPLRTAGSVRRHARAAGLFYLLTFAASIPAYALIGPAIDDPSAYITGGGSKDTQVLLGSFLDFVNALACIGTAVAVFPIMKRVRTSFALGFVATRIAEAAVIMTGVVTLTAAVTLRQTLAGTDAPGLATVGQALVAVRDWTFLFGPGFMPVFNALMFATLLYTSRLVPRWIPTLGLIGAPLLFASSLMSLFGHNEQMSMLSVIATLPIAIWELSIGIYMLTKGFRPTPITIS